MLTYRASNNRLLLRFGSSIVGYVSVERLTEIDVYSRSKLVGSHVDSRYGLVASLLVYRDLARSQHTSGASLGLKDFTLGHGYCIDVQMLMTTLRYLATT